MKNLKFYSNDSVVSITLGKAAENQSVWLFNGNSDTNTVKSKAKCYYAKIWEDDVLVRNFIPCYRKSDNEPGLYDTVNKVFYTNSGTGEFLVGPEV